MIDTLDALLAQFPSPDLSAWRSDVDRLLEGRDFDRALVRRTLDGVTRGPLMTGADAPAADRAGSVRRGPRIEGAYPWDSRVLVSGPDPADANAQALEALGAGVHSLALRIDPDGRSGVSVRGLDDMRAVLDGVHLEIAPVALEAGEAAPQAAALLVAAWRASGAVSGKLAGAFNIDPLGASATLGAPARALDVAVADAALWGVWTAATYPKVTALRADGRVAHEAGAGAATELGWTLACALAYLRAMDELGAPRDAAASQIVLTLAADADMHQTIAKLRVMRRLWRRVARACGASERAAEPIVEAHASRRMLTRYDAWTNMLRLTAAAAGAVAGGADVIALGTFTDRLGAPDALARRQSRNIQLILMEEAHLGSVRDPALGAYHHEAVAHDLADLAWRRFQAIEAAGGAPAFWESGRLAADVSAERRALLDRVVRRDLPIVGVSLHPLLGEVPPPIETPDFDAARAAADARTRARPAPQESARRSTPELLVPLASAGVDLAALAPYLPPTPPVSVTPLAPMHLAAPFEALRDRAHDASPAVRLVSLDGSTPAARRAWVEDALAVGGLRATGVEGLESGLAAVRNGPPGAPVVLAASDEALGASGADAVRALREAGARVWIAGAPRPELEVAGAQGFIYRGGDLAAALGALHAQLGVAHGA